MKFSIEEFLGKCDQLRRKLRVSIEIQLGFQLEYNGKSEFIIRSMLYHLFAFIECCYSWNWHTAQKMKFSIKDFWFVFSCVWTGYGDLILESPYSVWIQKNTDQKKLRIWTFFTQYLLSWITLWSCLEISFLSWNDGVYHFRP